MICRARRTARPFVRLPGRPDDLDSDLFAVASLLAVDDKDTHAPTAEFTVKSEADQFLQTRWP